MKSVFLTDKEKQSLPKKVATMPWAARLVGELKQSLSEGSSGGRLDYTANSDVRAAAGRARDIGLLYCATGDETHLPELAAAVSIAFELDKLDTPMPGTGQWIFGLFYGPFLYAYDLTRSHEIWLKDSVGERFECRLRELLNVYKEASGFVRNMNNTRTWYTGATAMLGGLLDDTDSIAQTIEGPLSFKTMLGLLHDGEMWPEPIPYSYGYVSSVLTIIAEVARNTGFEDLYHWETDDGQSLKNLYDGFLHHAMADGRIATHADAGISTEMGHLFPPDRRPEVLRLWGGQAGQVQSKFELAYRVWKDSKHAWVLGQMPERNSRDPFWGIPALTHGIELGPMEAPDATSRVWRSHGGVLLRADETDTYWGGDLPTVYMRRGHGIGHGHDDSGNIILNTFGRNLYPDHLLTWDYQPRMDPETGKERNPSHYSKARLAHNTVSMNCEGKGEYALSQVGSIQRSGPMKIGRFWGMRPPFRRTIGVTPEYVLDWCAAGRCVGADPHTEHTWDYHLHGLGLPELEGLLDLQPCTTLGKEYGYGPIDTRSEDPDNQWIRPGLSGTVDGPWSAIMREEYPLDPEAVRGVCICVLGEAGTRVITGHVPDYVMTEGWDATTASVGPLPRLGLLVVRRKTVDTDFLVIHQPFCGAAPPPLSVKRDDEGVTVTGQGFTDRINLKRMTCERAR